MNLSQEGEDKQVPLFGYEIIRDYVLSSILGKNEDDILYWAGKDLARKFPLLSFDEVKDFFVAAGWGTLEVASEEKHHAFYRLTDTYLPDYINDRSFRLEAGFLAQQMEKQKGYLCECHDEKQAKKNFISFELKWDEKEKRS